VEDLRRCREETGCEHFMLGRGALASPWLALEAARELGLPGAARSRAFRGTPGDWLPLLRRFAEMAASLGKPPVYAPSRIKQWLRLANHDGRLGWFNSLKSRQSLPDLLDQLEILATTPESGAPADEAARACAG